ncbi:phosphate ABC transporter permease subunit PstC [Thiomicrorhabdus sp. ZW0627]|uniref:phosphate ABC transporter permease subunit PstC n=1 Tax=Thiomicrorhabdus sp. ZW0627 TaxID=3039774 RepID=UPI00243673B2|nr:phosphate ABC transporter permease subunit PstC [Thiomicrorhabdus sp. ZW0627]MDG6774819.1 phosphate ABC transporter permease subunit PstC [Thiomicrorhabdus sp. ZW0627]
MEKIFARLSQISASLVFLVLIGTMVTLYIAAKPAIEEFGAYFMIDSRWAVDVPTESTTTNPNSTEQNETSDSPSSTASTEDMELDNGINVGDEDINIGDEDINVGGEDDINMGGDEDIAATTEVYGGAIAIVGTVFSTIIALLFAIPLAMGIAIFLSEIAGPAVAKPVGIAIELLAAIPSIIYGMWGLFYFGPFIASLLGGHSVSLLIAGLVLGVMIIPFMAALSRDAINTTPDVLKEAAYAVGATKFEVIKDIIFPYAKAGIIGSIIISLGRALGETMAVAFVIGGVFAYADSITAPTNSIPVVLANNFSESSGISLSSLFYLSLILFVVSFIIIFTAKHYFLRREKI